MGSWCRSTCAGGLQPPMQSEVFLSPTREKKPLVSRVAWAAKSTEMSKKRRILIGSLNGLPFQFCEYRKKKRTEIYHQSFKIDHSKQFSEIPITIVETCLSESSYRPL